MAVPADLALSKFAQEEKNAFYLSLGELNLPRKRKGEKCFYLIRDKKWRKKWMFGYELERDERGRAKLFPYFDIKQLCAACENKSVSRGYFTITRENQCCSSLPCLPSWDWTLREWSTGTKHVSFPCLDSTRPPPRSSNSHITQTNPSLKAHSEAETTTVEPLHECQMWPVLFSEVSWMWVFV